MVANGSSRSPGAIHNRRKAYVLEAWFAALRHEAQRLGRLSDLGYGGASSISLDDVLTQAAIRRNVVVRTANWVSVPPVLRSQPDLVSVVPGIFRSSEIEIRKPKV